MRLPREVAARLADRDEPVVIWWRDDDAGRASPLLDRLLRLAERHAAALALAVVPRWLEPFVIERISASRRVSVLQHGLEHHDHARLGDRTVELGGTAEPGIMAEALLAGRNHLADAFGGQFLPVMVPPWNRMDAHFAAMLPTLGFTGVSGWRGGGFPALAGLRRVDVHVDAMRWRPVRRSLRADELVEQLAAALDSNMTGPIGLMTHHFVTDEQGWQALDRLLGLVQDQPGLRLASAAEFFVEAT
jgi:hypothetical protein